MSIFYLDSGSISDLVVTNANLTGSLLGTASFANSASWAAWADQSEIGVAVGGSTNNNVSQLVFSNANNVSFGLNGSTATTSSLSNSDISNSNFALIGTTFSFPNLFLR